VSKNKLWSDHTNMKRVTENFRQFINEGQWEPKGAKAMAAATGGSRYGRDKGDDETKGHWEPKGARDMAIAVGGSRYSRDKGDDGGEIKEQADTEETAPTGEEEVQFKSESFCEEFPEACAKAFGAKRANMPQIPDAAEFAKELSAPPPDGLETNEPQEIPDLGQATRNYLNSSDDLGDWPAGDQVKVTTLDNIDPSDLNPTQTDIYMSNALKMVRSGEKAAETGSGWTPWNGAVLVSDDNFLLDGHHRWAATIVYNALHPEDAKKMSIEKVGMPIKLLLRVANAYTDAVGGKRHSGGGTTTERLIHKMIKEEIKKLKRNK